MASVSRKYKEAQERWIQHCHDIERSTAKIPKGTEQERKDRIARARKDYRYFVRTYFPHLATTECADFQVDAAVYMRDHENARGLFEWARGHAKSTHISLWQPLWLKIQPNAQPLIMILVSKSQEAARRLLGDLQAELESNDLYNADFGNQRGAGIWTNGEFTTATGDLFIALGRGQSPRGIKKRGLRPNYIAVDDIDDDELVRNPRRVGEAVDWLDDLGTDFGDRVPYFGVYQPLNVARNYSGKGGARAFVVSLYAELEKYFSTNAYMMLNTYVTGLVTNDEGAVIGAKARLADGTETTLLAPATVICTGGYAGNEELLNKYNFENVLSTSPACVTGDGYAWLEELGAPLTNMDFCTAYAGGIPTSDDFRSFGYFNATNGALWINTNGERMANETGADSHVKSETWANAPHNIVYTVFSSEMLIPDAKVFSTGAWGSVKEEFDPYMESLIEKGLAWKADTIEELAEKVGLPVDAFKATIAAYNDGCANGNDPFGRTKQEVAMANGPFYAVKTVPYVMITCGGPMMTKNCEVLNSDGLVIEGVYMAGEIVGMANVGGRNSIGGMGHGNCLVWGKKAAEVIAAKLGK